MSMNNVGLRKSGSHLGALGAMLRNALFGEIKPREEAKPTRHDRSLKNRQQLRKWRKEIKDTAPLMPANTRRWARYCVQLRQRREQRDTEIMLPAR